MKIRISLLIIALLSLACFEANAQKERKFIRKGNGLFENKNFENSEVEYRKALDKDVASFEAAFIRVFVSILRFRRFSRIDGMIPFDTPAATNSPPEGGLIVGPSGRSFSTTVV